MNADNRADRNLPSQGDLLRPERAHAPVRIGLIDHLNNWKTRVALAGNMLMTLAILNACAAPPKGIDITSTPTPQEAPLNLTPTVPSGIGGNEPIPTYPASDPRAATENPKIDAANKRNQEAIGTATAEAQNPPKLPPKETPTPEATNIEPVDNGILSLNAYKKAEYIKWDIPGGGTSEGIGITLQANEPFRIPEKMQVVAVPRTTVEGKPNGYRITAVRSNGSELNIYGDIIPAEGIGNIGKDLPAGTIVGKSGGLGLTVLNGEYTQFMTFSEGTDLKNLFVQQTKLPPKFIINKSAPQTQSINPGATFYDVKPPQGK